MGIPVCTVDATGIHAPAFSDVLTYLQEAYAGIYWQDVVLTPDTQDGQLLSILAAAVNDANAMAVAIYNSFSPATAQGTGLSSNVKLNGIARLVPSYSAADLVVVGQSGTLISAGLAQDLNGNVWALPANILIPASGQVSVTATCTTLGAISAPANSITSIYTPTAGWQSVSNPAAAIPGQPVESDALLRIRQAASTMLPSTTVLDGILGAIAALPGVSRYAAYENDGFVTDGNGLPPHSISLVVDGGDQQAIANTIGLKKSPGTTTYGTTTETFVDQFGIGHAINFYRPTEPPITWNIGVKALKGFTTTIQAQIAQAMSDWTNALGIGQSILLPRAWVPANLTGSVSSTFELTSLQVARDGAPTSASDVTIAFNEAPFCTPDYVTITVTT